MNQKRALTAFSGILGLAAIIIQMVYSLGYSFAEGRSLALGLNVYFSYFTVIMNSIVAVGWLCRGFLPQSKLAQWYGSQKVSGALCLYILIVGIIFYTLLWGTWNPKGWEAMATHTMHAYVPLMSFYLWFTDVRAGGLQNKDVLSWLWFPFVYFVYLMIRGQFVNLYPYFFVDVGRFGFGIVMAYAIAILVFFAVLGLGLIYLDRRFPAQAK